MKAILAAITFVMILLTGIMLLLVSGQGWADLMMR